MIFGNLNQVFEGDSTIYEAANNAMPIQQFQNANISSGPGRLAKILYKLSHYGMNWTSDVVTCMLA